MPPDRGTITIVELAHGFRIDLTAIHPSGESRNLDPVHQPSLERARQYAALFAQATGATIEERLRDKR